MKLISKYFGTKSTINFIIYALVKLLIRIYLTFG